MYYIFSSFNDIKILWLRLDMSGMLDCINGFLGSINWKLVVNRIRELYEVVLIDIILNLKKFKILDFILKVWLFINKCNKLNFNFIISSYLFLIYYIICLWILFLNKYEFILDVFKKDLNVVIYLWNINYVFLIG